MKNRLGWTGLLLASILMACGQAPQVEVAPQIPVKPAPVAFKPTMLGSITIDFDSRAKTATAHFDKAQTRLTSFPAETDFKFTKAILQVQTPTAGSSRFLTAQFSLENLNTATDYNNLTLIAYHKRSLVGSENVNGSAFTNIVDFGGGSTNAAMWALQLKPAHGMKTDGVGGFIVDDTHADMQIFTPSETSTIETDAQTGGLINNGVMGEGVLSYGYVARNASNGRSILHGTTDNSLAIGLQVPQNGDAGAGNTAYRYSETFLIFADNVTRVTESLEEQSASGAGVRATALGATEVRYLCGSSYAANNGVFIPGAKTVGVASVLAYLGGNLKITDNTAFNFAATGNTQLSVNTATGLSSKYATLDGAALGSATGGASSTNGGDVAIATDGSFTFTPKVNSRINDTFSYSVAGCTAPAFKAPVSVSDMVWYIDSSTAGGDGRSTGPLQSLSSLNVAAPNTTAVNDFIYVKNGSTGGTGFTLKNNQQLIGSGVALVVGANTLQAAGTAPTITSPITVVSDNTISGLTVGGISGTVGGTLTTSSASVVAGAAQAINLSGGTLAVSLTKVDSSGGVNGIKLSGTAGSFTVSGDGTTANSGGILQSNTGDGVSLTNTGNVSLNFMSVNSSGAVGINIALTSGSSTFTVNKSTVQNAGAVTAASGFGIQLTAITSAAPTFNLTDSTVQNNKQNGLDINTNNAALINFSATGANILKDNLGTHMDFKLAGTGNSTVNVNGTTVSNPGAGTGSGIDLTASSPSNATITQAKIQNNTIALNNTSGAASGTGIRVASEGVEKLRALVSGNTISKFGTYGIYGLSGNNASRLDLTLTTNTVSNIGGNSNSLDGIVLESGDGSGSSSTLCVNATGNNSTAINGFDGFYIFQDTGTQFLLQGFSGSAANTLTTLNAPSTVFDNGTPTAAAGTCTAPSF